MFQRIFQWFSNLSNWQKAFIVSLSLMSALVLGFFSVSFFSQTTTINSFLEPTNNIIKEEAKVIPNPINGILYTKTASQRWENRLPVAVMVENLVDIRPQSGLSKADIVYESLTEGGITRFLAVYLSEESEEIGPVRSARPHFIDWAEELGALYAYIGGSPTALSKIVEDSVKTLPEERPYYTRKDNSSLSSEHTAFASTKSLWEMAADRNYTGSPKIDSWKFKEEASPSARPAGSSIDIGFSGLKDYLVRWEYDSDINGYRRFIGNPYLPHLDKTTENQINAKNIIVHYSSHTALKDEKNRIDVQTLGKGDAKIFQDGVFTEATWQKDSPRSRTKYYDSLGKEVEFNRGNIWVEVVPIGSSVVYS